ncbi:MAG: glycosyltransferase, partial [bacterium]
GSSAVFTAGRFYDHAAAAARALRRRAVLLTGIEDRNPVAGVPDLAVVTSADPVVRVPYAPHSEVMPPACAVVHQGGIGTTAQALRAGRPTLVVPFSHDQPDNAMRVVRLGVGRTLPRSRVSAAAFVRELAALLADPAVVGRAREVAERVRHEPGAEGAADAIERLLATRRAR